MGQGFDDLAVSLAYNTAMPANRLLWAPPPLHRCPECQRPLSFHEVTLELHFNDRAIGLNMAVGHCTTSDSWLADVELVEGVLSKFELNLTDAEAFSVNDTPVEAAFWRGEALGAIPFEFHREATDRAQALLKQEAPSLEAVQALPQGDETWLISQAPTGYFLDDKKQPVLSHLGLIVTEHGLVRGTLLHHEALGAAELMTLIATACANPSQDFRSVRPRQIMVDNPSLAEKLRQHLGTLDIQVEVGGVMLAKEALVAVKQALTPEPTPSYFIHYPEHEVKAFFKAAGSFFRTQPWEVVDGHKFLTFRLGDGPWRYANVMGQAEEEYGLAVFKDWLEVCKATNNPETLMDVFESLGSGQPPLPKSLLATGGAESISLNPLDTLASEDAAFLKNLKIKPIWRNHYATVHRYTPYGLETPQLDISLYTGLMAVLTERALRVRGDRITSLKASFDTPKGTLTVRYPAKGDEASKGEGYYQFRVPFTLGAQSATLGDPIWAEVKAPGEAKWHRVIAALTKSAKTVPSIFPWVSEVMQGEYALWLDQAPVKEPSPTVEQLAKERGLTLKMGLEEHPPLEFEAIPRPEQAKVEVHFLDH